MAILPYFLPTKHLTLIICYNVCCWAVKHMTMISLRKLQQPNYWATSIVDDILQIKIHLVHVMNKETQFQVSIVRCTWT